MVMHFSCGAASAVAAKLTIAKNKPEDVLIVNAFIQQEHKDSARFLKDCERWFNHPITVLRNESHQASTYEVWRRKRFMNSRDGAPCSSLLKRKVLDTVREPGDVDVIGFTGEEGDRLDSLREFYPDRKIIAPLIDANLSKADCLAMVERAGIALPAMYLLGYDNNNCIGCVKGGEGYWNKIRRDFPAQFIEIAEIQKAIGPGAYLFRDRATGARYSLYDLPPDKGRYSDEPKISCSFFCQIAEQDIERG